MIGTHGSAVGTVHQEDKTIDQVVDVLSMPSAKEWRSGFCPDTLRESPKTHLERPSLRPVTVNGHVLTLEGPTQKQEAQSNRV